MYQNDALKVLTGEVRLSYVHLSEPYANPNQTNAKAKFSATLLIPKTDADTKANIDAAIEAAAVEATAKTWGGFRPPMLKSVLHDGDGVRQDGSPYGPECKGCWVLTASTYNRPQVVDQSNINCELAPQDIYSGMYGRVTVRFFGYSNSGNKGVGCGLGNVMKTRDGEALSGGAPASSDFAGVGQSVGQPAATGYAAPGYAAPAAGQQSYTAQAPGYSAGAAQINPLTGLPM